MTNLDSLPGLIGQAPLPCSRCGDASRDWDRLGGRALCTQCQEALVLGLAAPLRLQARPGPCAACSSPGTAEFLTFPLRSRTPVELPLCAAHLRALLGRDLSVPAFERLRQRLHALDIGVDRIFLLHQAFYDRAGRALQPAPVPE